jgi:NADH-quinone oxidoreductase subunit L
MHEIIYALVLFPLLGSVIAGFLGPQIGRAGAHWVTIIGVGVSFVLSCLLFKGIVMDDGATLNFNAYTWVASCSFQFDVGFLIDHLSVTMLVIVTFVSLLVHIYSIGYMHDDPGYQRFFAYISLFTFMMLLLVTGNNFFQLFLGWEGVGLVSYLLISFWFSKNAATSGGLKAFLVNRVGDFGMILGMGAILTFFGTIDFASVFAQAPAVAAHTTFAIFANTPWSVVSIICILLFIGAMGKSAQVPLHIWLPESMEGPTPISALIHAATMVTAGIYMVARLSPLYELSSAALSFILVIGATTALFTGIVGVVQNDIKRVIAYSTLSQLGYMVTALGVSAFSAGVFHLATHAAFKALLFLGAGSVILGMHHEQDMRKMGGLAKYMPITYVTFLIGALSLAAIPPFSGFYSKDAIIEAVHLSTMPGAHYAYFAVVAGAFVTALYTFRAVFMTFHGKPRMDAETKSHLRESPWVVWLPLVILAVPSAILGALWIQPMLFASDPMLGQAITVDPKYDVLKQLGTHFHGVWAMAAHSVVTLPFWFAIAGVAVAWVFYIWKPHWPAKVVKHSRWLHFILIKKYGFDDFNDLVFVRGTKRMANFFYNVCDREIIDNGLVNGSGRLIQSMSLYLKRMQTGYMYHYALAMIIGVLVFLLWQVLIN